jgi:hypothetical protein
VKMTGTPSSTSTPTTMGTDSTKWR